MLRQPAACELADDVPHVARGEELCFLDVDGPAGAGGGDQQIGLPGKKGRNLQQVADLAAGGGLMRLVNVGGDRQPGFAFHAGEDFQAGVQTRPAIRLQTGAVGFVERGFEHQLDRQGGRRSAPTARRSAERQVGRLQNAGAGDDQQRLAGSTAIGADRGGILRHDSIRVSVTPVNAAARSGGANKVSRLGRTSISSGSNPPGSPSS